MTHFKQDVSSLGCVDIMDQVNDDVFEEEGSISVTLENPVQAHDDMNNAVKGGTTVLVDGSRQEELGRGLRTKCPSTQLKHYVTHTIQCISPSACSSTPTSTSGTPYPIAHYVNCEKFSPRHRVFLAALTANKEPSSYAQALKDGRWREAMKKEINALENNGTWTVEDLPPGKRAIGSKWVYKVKYNSDGLVE